MFFLDNVGIGDAVARIDVDVDVGTGATSVNPEVAAEVGAAFDVEISALVQDAKIIERMIINV